jgi:hypothetical protein
MVEHNPQIPNTLPEEVVTGHSDGSAAEAKINDFLVATRWSSVP